MWIVNKTGEERVWYEGKLIDKIKKECQEAYNNSGLAQKIIELIKEVEK